MTHAQWLHILDTHDATMAIMALATVGLVLNWYAWPHARRAIEWLVIGGLVVLFVALRLL